MRANEAGPTAPRSRGPTIVLGASFLVLGIAAAWTVWQARHVPPRLAAGVELHARPWPETSWKNARPGVKYVGDAACVRCHAEIGETFRRHPMGRSLAPIARAPTVGGPRSDGTITFNAGKSQFTIERRGGREVHREAQLDEHGRVLAEVAAEVKYALGSGSRGVGYLVEHDGRLFQSPISWYSQKSQWDLSPGYEAHNFHFDRPIENQCLFCHANRVEPVALSVNHYNQPVFQQGEAIGCERCHGPGELHARGQDVFEGRDLTIVNPRHLTPALRAAVCEQCHLLGDQRIARLGRDELDYRPGLPSIEFCAVYGRAEENGVKAVGHVTQMKVSRCFRASEGRLGCISCHDPHQVPSPQEKTAYFRERCLACHEPAGCKLPERARLAESPDNNCFQCHMPKAKSTDIAHTSTTDHRIMRTPLGPAVEPSRPISRFPLVLLNGDHISPSQLGTLDRELAIALASDASRLPDTPQSRQMKSELLRLLDKAIFEQPADLIAKRLKAQVLTLSGRARRQCRSSNRC